MTFKQLISHSIFLGICAAFLSTVYRPTNAPAFAFFTTAAAYIFLRLSLISSRQKLPAIAISTMLMACGIGAGFTLSIDQKTTAAFAAVMLSLYIVPGRFSLRNKAYLKPITIGLCWSLMTVGLAFDNNLFFLPNDHSAFEMFLQIFFLTFFLSLLYDYRDVIFLKSQEKTLPKILSEKKFYLLLWIALVATFVGFILVAKNTHASVAYFIGCIYILFLFKKIKTLSYARATWLADVGFVVYGLAYIALTYLFS